MVSVGSNHCCSIVSTVWPSYNVMRIAKVGDLRDATPQSVCWSSHVDIAGLNVTDMNDTSGFICQIVIPQSLLFRKVENFRPQFFAKSFLRGFFVDRSKSSPLRCCGWVSNVNEYFISDVLRRFANVHEFRNRGWKERIPFPFPFKHGAFLRIDKHPPGLRFRELGITSTEPTVLSQDRSHTPDTGITRLAGKSTKWRRIVLDDLDFLDLPVV